MSFIKKFNSTILVGCLLLSLIGCGVFAYLWIDRSITLAYLSQSADSQADEIRDLKLLLASEWQDMPREKIMLKLQFQAARNKIIISEDHKNDAIWFDEVPFYFVSGKLKQIGRPH